MSKRETIVSLDTLVRVRSTEVERPLRAFDASPCNGPAGDGGHQLERNRRNNAESAFRTDQ